MTDTWRKERRGGHNRKVTFAQREEIISAFLNDGKDAATILSIKHGLNEKYASKLASERGLKPRRNEKAVAT